MNKLRKYSMRRLYSVKPEPFEGIIEFTVDGKITIQEGAYLTTNEFYSADEAHRYNAITYSPKFESIFELNEGNTREIELKNPYLGHDPTRIWPAFGLHGGGCEIILTKGELKSTDSKEKFPKGGQYDDFCQDRTKSGKIFVCRLAQILWDWLRKRKEEFPNKEELGMKIMDGLGVVISWVGVPSYKHYAISCGYKENEKKDSVDLRFWGYVWHDNETDKERILSNHPVPKDFPVDFGLEELKRRIEQGQSPKSEIENILLEIHKSLIPIAKNFNDYDNDKIKLPPYVSFYG